jgi:hypothetical protein
MNTTNTTTANQPRPAPLGRGFAAVCIRCGNPEAIVRLNLADVSEFKCDECGEEFTADDVRQFCGAWQRVLAWIDLADAIAG